MNLKNIPPLRESILKFINRCELLNFPEIPVRRIWEMDRETLNLLRKIHDEKHNYDWKPSFITHTKQGSLFDIEIEITNNIGLILKYIYRDRIVRIEFCSTYLIIDRFVNN